VGGVLSALPVIYFGNACCCMWVVAGGFTAAYVFQSNDPEPITPADGAVAGLLAGLLGAVVHLLLSIPIDILMAPFERTMAQRIMDLTGNEQLREMLQRVSEREAGVALIVFRRFLVFVVMLPIGAIFSTLGGLIGSMVFRKTPPVPLDATPR
jgi:hypothetical protein